MSAQECFNANWYERGAEAGRAGAPISTVLADQNACVHYGVVPDRGAFAEGWRHQQSS